ncbi:hypothetical protein BU24DRAFT_468991 [Aaosphaeria arxii CBS 175.79]|uniref:Uncharacterized protein n=1 Tax=Aaosphaeria arxii CBS 175.79 TaxID=1450172 RepID=A0A6A5X6I8_9PLEO|nr:uncharacterized protein BU24DRAFT_468991 [Aaosphaeria arxii CBS 175.79]KAF2008394.1 hypothetical protein BU24DRAFT_468991 [Aaosphaeria arxii CBS 175.79]
MSDQSTSGTKRAGDSYSNPIIIASSDEETSEADLDDFEVYRFQGECNFTYPWEPLDDDETWQISRISAGIAYAKYCRDKGKTPQQTADYRLSTRSSRIAIHSMQDASKEGLAERVWRTDDEVCYRLPVPPVAHGFRDKNPLWWYNKTPAEIKAGPFATAEEITTVENQLNALEQKRVRKRRRTLLMQAQLRMERKLQEGLRRTTLGLPMCDD